MTHSQRLVAVIKSNGKVLREQDGASTLPFGSEYSILIKNLDSRRIQVAVSVDGADATQGAHLIIGPNQDVELERFIVNGNLSSGNRFKFIERTGPIESHRGIGASDGLVRVEAWTEHVPAVVNVPIANYYDPYQHWPWRSIRRSLMPTGRLSSQSRSNVHTTYASSNYVGNAGSVYEDTASLDAVNDVGITVPGSESQQRFNSVAGFAVEPQSTVIVLRLRGVAGNVVVQQPVTVRTSLQCATCGRHNKGHARYCSQCGTALVII